jgi:hypothetical protein
MKKMLSTEVGTFYAYDCTPLGLIDKIKSYIELYGDTLYFEQLQETHGDSWYTGIMVDTIESDSEYESRLKREAFAIEERESQQRKMYAILKAKFEN